jgi:aryl-alcohol dehydrogenase-like predicted oxidoreductase
MGMSQSYGPADEGESLRVLDRAIELGCNLWDTADVYGGGRNERLLAKALMKHRQKVFLCTKVGNVYDRQMTTHQDLVQQNIQWIVDGTPEYIHKCIDQSLMRLGVDKIDLYYLHRVDPQVPIEDTVGAMSDAVRQGKVRFLGLSEASSDTIRRAMKIHPITALQTEYSLWTRHVEPDILPTCRELGITFVPYSPLGRGFLTGTLKNMDDLSPDDFRKRNPRFMGENFHKNLGILPTIERIARQHHATPAQIAIAWVLSQGDDLIPIPGTKRVKYLEDNVAAADIRLTPEELHQLDGLHASGERYPEVGQRYLQY